MGSNNSIADMRPDLAAQFDFKYNYPLTPEDVSVYSERKIGWVCEKGHTWINDPRHRMRAKHPECPFCSGRMVTPGANDLITLCPHLESEWNYGKNGELDPRTLHRLSNIKVWWKCDRNHEWEARISNRTKEDKPTGCPYCAGRKASPGVNDLASQRPDLAAQFDLSANYPLTAEEVPLMSTKKVGWTCDQGHRWINDPQHRAREKSAECPYCSGHKVIQGDDIQDYRYRILFHDICHYKELTENFNGQTYKVAICHYPILMWSGQHRGTILLYGHTHQSVEDDFFQECIQKMNENEELSLRRRGGQKIRAINVGCMQPWMDYEPRTLKEILTGYEEYKK